MCKNYFYEFENGQYLYEDIVDDAYRFVCKKQLLHKDLWKRFAMQFKIHSDSQTKGWRGEFWGKMMRGACLVYSYTKDESLYKILKETVEEIISLQEANGRISSYDTGSEFSGWDMWCRKYVILGMEYFIDICKENELKDKIIESMCSQVDYILSKVGLEDGKIHINDTTNLWRGLNSSSILEPIIRLYQLTGEKRYLDFSTYIIQSGGTGVENIFALAYENQLLPYQYPITKAYEMISCFEGVLEYYLATGNEKCKQTVINFAERVLESDFTVIGCAGCTEELFDHSSVRQANRDNGFLSQETCVTVTLMKFMSRMHLLTGDSKYVDAYEKSFYNAYLGSFNTMDQIEILSDEEQANKTKEILPFDSYSPLTKNTRGKQIGGKQIMPDGHYYGCCASIASAGVGMFHKIQALKSENSLIINLFAKGEIDVTTPFGKRLKIRMDTEYPVHGKVKIVLYPECAEQFDILIRNPLWSENSEIISADAKIVKKDGYFHLSKIWNNEDTIEINLDMRTKAILPPSYESQILMNKVIWEYNYVVPTYDSQDPEAKNHVAFQRGPLMLALDTRLGYRLDEKIGYDIDNDGYIDAKLSESEIPYPCIIKTDLPLKDGNYVTATDYSSAGKIYHPDFDIAVWLYRE